MKIIISCSGGKDSVAALLWMRNNGYKNFDIVFCDTGWESQITYDYLNYLEKELNFNLITLKSKKFDGMVDLATKKKRFPSSQRRFCTSELKVIPMIDYLLDVVKDDFLIVQGIRGAESVSRSKMQAQCNYFKYYIEPYGVDKKGKPKYHTYRRKEILEYTKKHATDVFRPIFDWTAQQTINYIIENNIEVNSLYSMGMKRVGCFPCIMSGHLELHQLSERFPKRIEVIAKHEKDIGSSFFSADKIPRKYYAGKVPLITDIVRYVKGKYDVGELFDDVQGTSCMSYYGLCE